jgi:hypothetical protein
MRRSTMDEQQRSGSPSDDEDAGYYDPPLAVVPLPPPPKKGILKKPRNESTRDYEVLDSRRTNGSSVRWQAAGDHDLDQDDVNVDSAPNSGKGRRSGSPWPLDYGCDGGRFRLSAHDFHVPSPTSQHLGVEQQIGISLKLQNQELPARSPSLSSCFRGWLTLQFNS